MVINAGAMAQWLRAPAVFPEDRRSIASVHVAAHNHL